MAVKRNTVVQGVFQTFRQQSWLAVMQSLTLWKRHLSLREKGMQHISPNPDLPDKGLSDTEQLVSSASLLCKSLRIESDRLCLVTKFVTKTVT
eukprot:6491782-Amphidinium_carterae.2